MDNIRQVVEEYKVGLYERKSVLDYRYKELNKDISECLTFQKDTFHTLEVMKMTSVVLQDLVDAVSTKNIIKIEQLLNSALSTVFWDMNITVKIERDVKRNRNIYDIVIYKDGNRGTLKSNGGGVWSVVAVVLKILTNVLMKRYPLIVYDEHFSMIADQYIPATIKFVDDLAKSLSFSVCSMTHKVSFIETSPVVYKVEFAPNEEREFLSKQGCLEEPYIKVEKIERMVREDEEINV
jgi:hypothetical protein